MLNFDYLESMDTKEESLVTAFEHYLNKVQNGNFIIMKELDCWQGRADIVKAHYDKVLKVDIAKAKTITNLTNAKLISLLHYKAPRTFEYLRNKTYLSPSTLRNSIRQLNKAEIVEITKNGNYVLDENFKIPIVIFDAYEAKISNWKRALYQALQYRGFAKTSTVVMPTKHIKNALLHYKEFEINGIGLIEMKLDGKVIIHIKPKKYQPRRKDFYLVGVGKFLEEITY